MSTGELVESQETHHALKEVIRGLMERNSSLSAELEELRRTALAAKTVSASTDPDPAIVIESAPALASLPETTTVPDHRPLIPVGHSRTSEENKNHASSKREFRLSDDGSEDELDLRISTQMSLREQLARMILKYESLQQDHHKMKKTHESTASRMRNLKTSYDQLRQHCYLLEEDKKALFDHAKVQK